jgi:hypothetical protein
LQEACEDGSDGVKPANDTPLLALARLLLADNAEHVAACRVIDGKRC